MLDNDGGRGDLRDPPPLGSAVHYREVSGYLVGSAAFKAVGMGDPHPAGSIPVHLRQTIARRERCITARQPWLAVDAALGDQARANAS